MKKKLELIKENNSFNYLTTENTEGTEEEI